MDTVHTQFYVRRRRIRNMHEVLNRIFGDDAVVSIQSTRVILIKWQTFVGHYTNNQQIAHREKLNTQTGH